MNDEIGKKVENVGRREALKQLVTLPVLGGLTAGAVIGSGFAGHEDRLLAAHLAETEGNTKPDAVSGPTRTSFKEAKKAKLKELMPLSEIGNLHVSRMILGGNLIGGWAHARDLIYVSDLVKAYHTKGRVFETFYNAEECGINTFLGYSGILDMVEDYWDLTGGKMQFFADCGGNADTVLDTIKRAFDKGATTCYVQGQTCDTLVEQKRFDVLEKALELIRGHNVPGGLGGHYIETIESIVAAGIQPDFWMKTFHHLNYWSSDSPRGECDNIYDRHPERTREFMETQPAPWIAFKVLAAGAIHPHDGFRFAFEGGADFLCVGMYDFQLIDDVNIACDILNSPLNRKRPWITPTIDRSTIVVDEEST